MKRPVDSLHVTDRDSPGRKLGRHHRRVHPGRLVLGRDSRLSRGVVAGRNSGRDSPSRTTGEAGTG